MSIVRISEYVWDRGTQDEIPGVRLRNKIYGGFVFLPLTELVAVSDFLVDFIEQRENNKEN